MKPQITSFLELISSSMASETLSKMSGLELDMSALNKLSQAKDNILLDRAESPPFLADFGENAVFDKAFISDGSNQNGHFGLRHLVGNDEDEYQGACANPAILYQGTPHTAACFCDDSKQDISRILCVLDQPDCSLGVCIEQRDTWIFQVREKHGRLDVVCPFEHSALTTLCLFPFYSTEKLRTIDFPLHLCRLRRYGRNLP